MTQHEPRWPCSSCRKWLRRLSRRWWPAGRHGAHRCEGQTVGRYATVVCDCHCKQDLIASIVANGGFPSIPPRSEVVE